MLSPANTRTRRSSTSATPAYRRRANAGIDAAAGTYVVFIDGDDFLRRDAVEIVLQYLDGGAEGVFFRMADVYGDEEVQVPDAPEDARARRAGSPPRAAHP